MFAQRIHRALAKLANAAIGQPHIHAAHTGLRRERDFGGFPQQRLRSVEFLRQRDDAPALGRLICNRRLHGAGGKHRLRDAGRWEKAGGLAVSVGDGAGFVEQQHIHITGCFHRTAGCSDDIGLHHAAHARHANRRQQAAYGGRNQAHQQSDQRSDADHRTRACSANAED